MFFSNSQETRGFCRTASRFGGVCALALISSHAAAAPATGSDTWVAVDGLGRSVPSNEVVGDPRPNKTVGIFYYMWHQRAAGDIYDISKIIAQTPPPWGPSPAFHWWGEPQLGYYEINDDFVLRKHAQMLADAGVDLVTFDVTNAYTYDSTYQKICAIYQDIRKNGGETPQISFIAWSSADTVVEKLYEDFYAKGTCSELWFQWLGKPLIFASPDNVTEPAKDFFTFRMSWAWTNSDGWFGNGQDKWPWLDNHPQNYGWHDAPGVPEEIVAGIAQHPSSDYGRSYHDGSEPPVDGNWLTPDTANGLGFQEQWQRALQVDPPFVFVTQWNEWIAQRFIHSCNPDTGISTFLGQPLACGGTYFIDEYNQEFSRDAEPMRGGHGDAYYYQLTENIRQYKGAKHVAYASPPRAIDPSAAFTQWHDVRPSFFDDTGDVTHRNWQAYAGPTTYQNSSGRNDITLAKVSRDDKNVCFYAETAAPLSPSTDTSWMELLIDSDDDLTTGWNGYELLVNRTRQGNAASVEQHGSGDFEWTTVGNAQYSSAGNELELCVPRGLLGNAPRLQFNFKWFDNLPATPSPADFIDQGDVAPNGRFAYHFAEPILRWDFTSDAQGWGAAHALTLSATNGALNAQITGNDPNFLSPVNIEIDAAYHYLTIRLRNETSDNLAQIYFLTDDDATFDESKHLNFALTPSDPGFTDYTLDMATVPTWSGVIKQLRVDPVANLSSGQVVIDSIALSDQSPDVIDGGDAADAGSPFGGGAGAGAVGGMTAAGHVNGGHVNGGNGAGQSAAGSSTGGMASSAAGAATSATPGAHCGCRAASGSRQNALLCASLCSLGAGVARRRRTSPRTHGKRRSG